MPWVIVEPGLKGPRNYHEGLTTYLCDWPDCTRPAEQAMGCIPEIGACAALCAEHAKKVKPARGPFRRRS
jgi:hypothetical protein